MRASRASTANKLALLSRKQEEVKKKLQNKRAIKLLYLIEGQKSQWSKFEFVLTKREAKGPLKDHTGPQSSNLIRDTLNIWQA